MVTNWTIKLQQITKKLTVHTNQVQKVDHLLNMLPFSRQLFLVIRQDEDHYVWGSKCYFLMHTLANLGVTKKKFSVTDKILFYASKKKKKNKKNTTNKLFPFKSATTHKNYK